MAELQRSRAAQAPKPNDQEDEHYQQAIAASQSENTKPQDTVPERDEELEAVLARSLKEQRRQRSSHSEWDSDNTNDDEDFQRALKESQKITMHDRDELPPAYDPGTMGEEAKRQQAQGATDDKSQGKTEEEIVLEYVKKQSLLEEEHRQKQGGSSS